MNLHDAGISRVVSRETLERLEQFEALIRKWNRSINLVAPSTLDNVWTRHFIDSIQLFQFAPESATSWADLGSGGGFPGIVIAILAAEDRPSLSVTLVESDKRKAAFLTTAAHSLGLELKVYAERIESVTPLNADVLSARALTSLDGLLSYAERHLGEKGICLFPKGAAVDQELAHALEHWRFSYQKVPSATNKDGVILKIGDVSRA